MKRIPPTLRNLANRPTRYSATPAASTLTLSPLSRSDSTLDSAVSPTGVPPTRSLVPPVARAASPTAVFSPRQLNSRLDSSVVGQTKAKRVLSVAVYNHYIRVHAIRQALADRAADSARIQDREDAAVAFESPYPSHNFSVFNRDEFRSPTTSSPPRTKKPTLPDRTKEALLPRPLPAASQEEHLAYKLQEQGMEGDLTADPEDGAGRTSPKRSPIMTFENSYPPNSVPVPRKRRPTPIVTLLPPDPTAYDSAPLPAETPKRKSTKQPSESSFESETLTDFPGQVSGTARDVFLPRKPKTGDGDALVQDKSNVLILGPTGSGKTLLVKTLANFLDVPFAACEATGLTMAGYVGEDVESCVQRLLVSADWDVDRASTGIIFIDEIDKLARSSSASYSKDVSGEGVQQALLKLLEGTVVSVPDKEGAAGGRSRKGPAKETHLVDTTNILFILAGAFVGLDKIVAARMSKGNSIGFTAQLNKADSPQANLTPRLKLEAEQKKQKELLAQVEPADLFRYGFIQEFIGRLPVIATLNPLSESDLLRVLTEPRNALVKQYEQLFKSSNVECRFTTPALKEIAKAASGKGTGARGLRRIMESLLLDSQYEVPDSSVRYLLITRDVALGKTPALYYSRGQESLFSAEFDAEENRNAEESSGKKEETEEHHEEPLRATG